MNGGLALVAALLLVLVNACFVAAEFAIVTIRRSKIEAMVRSGNRRARMLQEIVSNLDSHLSATQLAITSVGLAIGWLGEPAFAEVIGRALGQIGIVSPVLVHSIAFVAAFFLITSLVVVAGELAPKFLGLRRTETVALWTAPLVFGFAKLTAPVLGVLNYAASLLLRMFGVAKPDEKENELEPEELRIVLSELSTLGRISGAKRQMLENVFEFSEHTARHVMIPRDEIVYMALDRPLEENLKLVEKYAHTRYPLCESKLDSVVGLIHIKDLFQKSNEIQSSEDLSLIKHDMHFVPESQAIDDLQRDFQRKRAHMAMVVDEYGVPTGLVTMEDVLEELVGEIRDEFDEDEQPMIVESKDGIYVDGMLLFEDLCRQLEVEMADIDADTVGGFVTTSLGKIARVGDRFDIDNYDGRVVEMRGRRVARVVLTQREQESDDDTGATDDDDQSEQSAA